MLSAVATLLQLLRLWFSLPNKPSRDLTVAYLVNKATRGAARTQVSTFKATQITVTAVTSAYKLLRNTTRLQNRAEEVLTRDSNEISVPCDQMTSRRLVS